MPTLLKRRRIIGSVTAAAVAKRYGRDFRHFREAGLVAKRKTAESIRDLLQIYGFDLEIEQSKEVLYEIMKTDKNAKAASLTS